MIAGRSIIHWIVVALIAAGIFFVAQWLIPLVFNLIGISIPGNIVNILALLIAIGVFYGGYSYRRAPA